MDFESKHNPRGLHMWGKMLFQPNTFSLEDPSAVCSEQVPVCSEALVIRIVKHSQQTNERTIRHGSRRQGQGCGSSLLYSDRNFTEFTNVAALGLSNLSHPHLLPQPEKVSLSIASFCILPPHQPTALFRIPK